MAASLWLLAVSMTQPYHTYLAGASHPPTRQTATSANAPETGTNPQVRIFFGNFDPTAAATLSHPCRNLFSAVVSTDQPE